MGRSKPDEDVCRQTPRSAAPVSRSSAMPLVSDDETHETVSLIYNQVPKKQVIIT
jgi:hypothetical protein